MHVIQVALFDEPHCFALDIDPISHTIVNAALFERQITFTG